MALIWGQFRKRYLSHHLIKLAWKLSTYNYIEISQRVNELMSVLSLTLVHTPSFTRSPLAPISQSILNPFPRAQETQRSLTSCLEAHAPFRPRLHGFRGRLARQGVMSTFRVHDRSFAGRVIAFMIRFGGASPCWNGKCSHDIICTDFCWFHCL